MKMYGFKGQVAEISQFEFSVTVENNEPVKVILPKEEWNDSFEITPAEVAFNKALDLLNL